MPEVSLDVVAEYRNVNKCLFKKRKSPEKATEDPSMVPELVPQKETLIFILTNALAQIITGLTSISMVEDDVVETRMYIEAELPELLSIVQQLQNHNTIRKFEIQEQR